MFCAYVTPRGRALIDRELYLPRSRPRRHPLRPAQPVHPVHEIPPAPGRGHRVTDPRHLDPAPPADTLWIIDTLDHLPDIPAVLGPALDRVSRVICENLRTARSDGGQRFHIRRSHSGIGALLARYGLHEHPACRDSPITVFTRRSTSPRTQPRR